MSLELTHLFPRLFLGVELEEPRRHAKCLVDFLGDLFRRSQKRDMVNTMIKIIFFKTAGRHSLQITRFQQI
jgi:hypothetical protein